MAKEQGFKFEEKKTVVVDDVKETVSSFMDKIARAKADGIEYIETSPEMIQFYNRNGLNGSEYFIYSGIKVFPEGKAEAILNKEAEQIGQRIHGIQEGVVIGG